MSLSTLLACLVAVIYLGCGVPMVLALAPMRELAAQVGFSVRAYRVIGGLEIAGAMGVLVGLAVPLLGGLAAAGLLVVMSGAVIAHLRNGHGVRDFLPAVLCGLLVAGYLAALSTA